MIQRAIAFATKAHDGQLRKGTMRPYILHPLEVGVIVARMTEDEEVISAAILHDTIEDCEGVTAQMIEQMFSKRVAELVQKESEDKSKTWMERKGATIQHLKVAEREVQMIGLADKLYQYTGYRSELSRVRGGIVATIPDERQRDDWMVL